MSAVVTLLIGTKRGLFVATSDARREHWQFSPPRLPGRKINFAFIDPRDGSAWAATYHKVWGAHVHRSTDGGATWEVLPAAPHYSDQRGLEAIWHLAAGPVNEPGTLYAGIQPAGLFMTRDRGATWQPIDSLNEHSTNTSWQPAGGALALSSIQLDPSDQRRIYCALSAGGVYRSDDAGASWQPCNRGTRADFLPAQYPELGQCVHRLLLHPALPSRLYQQNHTGVYRSDDRGESWFDITSDLPSGFGYALAVDPADANVAYVIPEESSEMRTTVEGKLRVYRTRDAGRSWQAMRRGLPQQNAYVSILRDAMCNDAHEPVGLYFGTSSGHLFASVNRGESWTLIASYLPRILSVTAFVQVRG